MTAFINKEVIIPRLGSSDGSDEVRILRWIKSQGTRVKKGDALLEVGTDKVNVEVEAPGDSTLIQVSAHEGDFVKYGAVVAVIEK